MKIYYAHHVWKYDTPIENFEIKCIERQFKDAVIVNPRTTIPQDQPESVILDYAYKSLDDCEAIVFSTFSGMIGHGVFNEIIYAFNAGKKVYQLDGTECIEIRSYTDFIEHGIRDFIFRGDNRMYAVVNSPCW